MSPLTADTIFPGLHIVRLYIEYGSAGDRGFAELTSLWENNPNSLFHFLNKMVALMLRTGCLNIPAGASAWFSSYSRLWRESLPPPFINMFVKSEKSARNSQYILWRSIFSYDLSDSNLRNGQSLYWHQPDDQLVFPQQAKYTDSLI